MMKCLLLFTRFRQDEISTRDELIPLKKAGMKFHPGMKKILKVCKHFARDEILQWACFYLIFNGYTQYTFQL